MGDGAGRSARQASALLSRVTWTDESGRMWATLVPHGREADAQMGVPLGPPDTTSLGLPEHLDVALNNELVRRGLLTRDNLRGRDREIFAALQAVFRVDVVKIVRLYQDR